MSGALSASTQSLPSSLLLVGAGKMGGAMLRGWLALGLPASAVTVIDPAPAAELLAEAEAKGFRVNPDRAAIGAPEVIVLAVKPQTFATAAPDIAPLVGARTLVISIMAGKTLGDIGTRLPGAAGLVRAMPNTPAAVGRGITGATASPGLDPALRARADALLAAIGRVVWVETEEQIDAVTAVSGSGPAYVFYLAECMAAAGVEAGLPPEVAAALARATVEGAGELMFRDTGTSPGKLRENVTSPGGTTAAALEVLMADDGLRPLMARAIAAAKRRAAELSG